MKIVIKIVCPEFKFYIIIPFINNNITKYYLRVARDIRYSAITIRIEKLARYSFEPL